MATSTSGPAWHFPGDIPGGWSRPDKYSTGSSDRKAGAEADKDAASGGTETRTRTNTSSGKRRTHWPPRQCRICLEVVQPRFESAESTTIPAALRSAPKVTYTSEDGGRLLRPCKCKGTQKYVHEDCLSAWRLADPLKKRNYWECPTCRYRYHLQRLTWASYISSTASQIGLTIAILCTTIFVLGFVADPIINLYLDPYHTIISAGGPTGSLIYEDEPTTWIEHGVKGLASLGLLGFAKLLFTLNPFYLRTGGFGGGGGRAGHTGRDRITNAGWIAILVGVITFLVAVWKAVRAWSRKTLEAAGERVMDVPGINNDDEDDE